MTSENPYARWLERGGEFFEDIISAIYKAQVRLGDHVLDVGANHGRHTFPLAECVGRRGRVIAIEALPHLAKNLVEMTRQLPQVRVINKAMSSVKGETKFTWVKRDEGFSGLRERSMPEDLASDLATIDVKTSTIDKAVKRWRWLCGRRISFIKMDIEGGEYDALRGAMTLLSIDKPIIVFENGGPNAARLYNYTEDDFFSLFDSVGYEVFDLSGRDLTRQSWNAPDTPWYGVAVARQTDGIAFVKNELHWLVERLEGRMESEPAGSRPQ